METAKRMWKKNELGEFMKPNKERIEEAMQDLEDMIRTHRRQTEDLQLQARTLINEITEQLKLF